MKKILFAALAVFALASCAKDLTTEVQQDAIDFNPVTKGSVRSNMVTGTNLMSFNVWGYHGDDAIMDGIDVTRPDASTAWTYTDKKYWPAEGTVDFYGFYIAEAGKVDGTSLYQYQFASTAEGGLTFDVNVGATDGVVRTSYIPDPVYAVALDKSKDSGLTTDGKVEMNFRHAMAKVDFQVLNKTTQTLDITIHTGSVYIDGLYAEGRYTTSTDKSTNELGSEGSWDFSNFTETKYLFHGDGLNVEASSTVSGSILSDQACMVFPQQKDSADIEVPCKISQNGVVIFDGVKTAKSINIDWKEGYIYTYILTFDDDSIEDLSKTIEFTTVVTDITSGQIIENVRPE